MGAYRLEVKDLHKRFPGVYAVKGVSFQIEPGEVHALVGENGAGKSTLMKMITGEYTPDEGEVYYNGTLLKNRSIADSQKAGIAMIHQELAPLPDMSIAENIFLGQEIFAYYSDGKPYTLASDGFRFIGKNNTPIIIFLVIVLCAHVMLKKTKFGRYIYATGGNLGNCSGVSDQFGAASSRDRL